MSSAQNRIALVLGATGGIGGETATALTRHGWHVRALARRPDDEAARRQPGWEWVRGDSMDAASVVRASTGASLIVHAVNPPGYRHWDKLVLPMLESTVQAARASGARILLPGTIYNYGTDAWPTLQEDSPQHPTSRKGKIRVQLEQRLEQAAKEGVCTLILRLGDFFGPRPGNSWFSQGLVKPGRPVTSVTYPGQRGVGHAWAYLPDAAETFARLAEREAELEPFARFHFTGHWDPDGTAMTASIGRASGHPSLKVKAFPWWLMKLASPFNETLREPSATKPLWRAPIRLDNTRLGRDPVEKMEATAEMALAAELCAEGALGQAGSVRGQQQGACELQASAQDEPVGVSPSEWRKARAK